MNLKSLFQILHGEQMNAECNILYQIQFLTLPTRRYIYCSRCIVLKQKKSLKANRLKESITSVVLKLLIMKFKGYFLMQCNLWKKIIKLDSCIFTLRRNLRTLALCIEGKGTPTAESKWFVLKQLNHYNILFD